jgi:hypothetical protein
MNLTASKLKVTLVLKAPELLEVPAVDGKARTVLRVKLPDRVVSADVATKSLRRAQTTIKAEGVDNVACILQGVLVANDVITDADLVVKEAVDYLKDGLPDGIEKDI